ncbi:hypothetical protein KBX06_24130 [Micromonospora sp. C31]|uniref:hypothetical protein n=1 Tax=Micromonospora sp. C31 TaxID=2824876 RepID=UPI001B396D13|nr:hypothetical protein [Micromonospora sp. C31]MBQ1076221.1 hypothetical protein [Micromonospora sp. C31]
MSYAPRPEDGPCRPTASPRTRVRPVTDRPVATRVPARGVAPGPSTVGPAAVSGLCGLWDAGGQATPDGAVRVRFTPSEVPVLTSCPADRTAAVQVVARTLARLGRCDLGGTVEVSASGPVNADDERAAAVLAVEYALRGGRGAMQLPVPTRWPAPAGCGGGCPCPTTIRPTDAGPGSPRQ